ncbi:MAG: PIG-L family deacetylase [Candidatus Nanopelagicales bacterium]
MPRTIVFFHAHPDDEALLTSGTMARADAEGARVVLITATAGEAGLADDELTATLGSRRVAELERSARILGVQRLEVLGYPDSGLDGAGSSSATPFCRVPVPEVARRVADICAEERADVLVGYDASGGYGHPDHVHVHRCARAAGDLLGVTLFEATAPRWPFAAGVRLAEAVAPLPADFDPQPFRTAFTPSREITHRVDVRDYADFKRAALAAHASQATGADVRTLGALLRLPRPIFRSVLGTEYYRRVR